MDQPEIDPAEHVAALRGLLRLNRASRTNAGVWNALRRTCDLPADRPLRVLDVASGGGDVSIGLWRSAHRAGVAVVVHGVDVSPTAVKHASDQAPEGAPVEFSVRDVLAEPLPTGCDAAVSTLFLHHLAEADAVELLRRMAAAANVVVVSDLRRSLLGYGFAHLACRVLSRSPIVHVDGPRSVEGAFTIPEFRRLAAAAGMPTMKVMRAWPQRFLGVWRRDEA